MLTRPTLSLTLHSRGSISSRPWEDLVTTVGRSYHGRGKVKIAVPSRENALYSFLNLLYIYLTPILSFHLINKIFIFHLQYYLSTFTWRRKTGEYRFAQSADVCACSRLLWRIQRCGTSFTVMTVKDVKKHISLSNHTKRLIA